MLALHGLISDTQTNGQILDRSPQSSMFMHIEHQDTLLFQLQVCVGGGAGECPLKILPACIFNKCKVMQSNKTTITLA